MTTTTENQTRVYGQLRDIAEAHGYRMWHEKEGHVNGVWIVEAGATRRLFESNGSGYPELDRLYVRKVVFPRHYTDYTNELVGNAESVFLSMVKVGQV